MTDAEILKTEVMDALAPHAAHARDGLLDARSALMKSMAIADEHDLKKLHKEIASRVIVIDDVLPVIDDLITFVSPSAFGGPRMKIEPLEFAIRAIREKATQEASREARESLRAEFQSVNLPEENGEDFNKGFEACRQRVLDSVRYW